MATTESFMVDCHDYMCWTSQIIVSTNQLLIRMFIQKGYGERTIMSDHDRGDAYEVATVFA